ncbi:metallophosphoesterase [Pontibacter sp. JH31]|uniref:Metallophosphoesterase n=1 Tax=Pontibacter aquaedesilientis TaxID=2766980 RepID=A0ABR7XFA2_9BACT|nr:metallophosphoesterase [Pontibacter aquaedesilientis]MBD1396071.1 metallophosphoesterase [Pontibacter aquaedesilientis]
MTHEPDKSGNLILKELHGHFHIIGDVHGCFDELLALLLKLGYQVDDDTLNGRYNVLPPKGCMAVFVGDLVDRGPNSPEVLRLVMDMVEQDVALCVSGNHDDKLYRKLLGRNVQVRHGLELTVAQLENYDKAFHDRVREFLAHLPHHIILDDGRLVVAHAGLEERLHGRHSKSVRDLCLYGPTTGELDARGLPVRLDWAADYSGMAVVVYGHTPVYEPRWKNNTINIDTGCVFGGKLTSLTYPDHLLTTIEAFDTYAESVRPFLHKSHH